MNVFGSMYQHLILISVPNCYLFPFIIITLQDSKCLVNMLYLIDSSAFIYLSQQRLYFCVNFK